METKVKKIVLQIADKEIELTLEQAKELKEILLDLFQEKNCPLPFEPNYPLTPIQPILDPYQVPPWKQFEIWCDGQGNYNINCK